MTAKLHRSLSSRFGLVVVVTKMGDLVEIVIAKLRDDFLRALSVKDTVVVCGETGCGKTTQIPQFVLDDEIENLRARLPGVTSCPPAGQDA